MKSSNKTGKPHKWAQVIKAWADGKPIQFRHVSCENWVDNDISILPCFDNEYLEWRVKPKNMVIERCATPDGCVHVSNVKNNLRLEFDHDTKKLVKAEVIG